MTVDHIFHVHSFHTSSVPAIIMSDTKEPPLLKLSTELIQRIVHFVKKVELDPAGLDYEDEWRSRTSPMVQWPPSVEPCNLL